jgi:Sap, sulfolipid-1-addressing protein
VDIAAVLPLAFVMVAGPQIISAFFFATSDSWKKSSAAYALGAIISITAVVTAAYLLANRVKGGGGGGSRSDALDYVFVALLLLAMVNVFRKRRVAEPPKWMGRLQTATPGLAFVLGFLLLGFFPSDLVTSISVGGHLANRGDPWWHALPFIALAILLLTTPALFVALFGHRAQAFLPKARDWMNANSWVVSEAVIAFFIVIILSD